VDLKELLKPLCPYRIDDIDKLSKVDVASIEIDSRQVKSGALFVCLKGSTLDGHDYVKQAEQSGAVAILAQMPIVASVPNIMVPDTRRALAFLADRFFNSPTQRLKLIGATGTNGKTTITYLMDHIIGSAGFKTGRIGTINMKIDGVEYAVKNTTPESLQLQAAFHQMVQTDTSYAFMEVSSHALIMGRVRGCRFKTMIFTNLTQDHLDFHGTMEAYKQAKGLAFAQLGNDYKENALTFAVLNADDETHDYYKSITSAQVITYGIKSKEADILARDIVYNGQGTSFVVESFKGKERIAISLLGQFNVYNTLAVLAAGIVEGLSLQEMKQSLSEIKGIPGRLETIDGGQSFPVIVDYAHTPDSLENVLSTLQALEPKGIIYCVVGCGGNRDKGKRPLMAQIATHYAHAIFTSDNPRQEDPKQILQEMIAGLNASDNLHYDVIVDRMEAISYALQKATAEDIVLIAGKGHETYQELKDKTIPFDDRQIALTLLQQAK